MMVGLFTENYPNVPRSGLRPLMLRGFTGGLDTIDSDETLSPKYAVSLKNLHRTLDGSLSLRQGSFWFADVAGTVTGNIIGGGFHGTKLIVVTSTGQAATIDSAGTVTAIWNTTIASALPGAPAGWSSGLTRISTVPYKNSLNIHNGVDKPIKVAADYSVTYLQDLASGSNVNVPIGKYACTVGSYHCIAGIADEPTLIIASSFRTDGTFVGDADSDAIEIDVAGYTPGDADEIRGIAGYRNYLFVYFRQNTLILKLGEYVDEVHTPQFEDVLPSFGLLSQQCIVPVENDLFFAGPVGFASAKRNLLAGLVESQSLSALIANAYGAAFNDLTQTQEEENCFAAFSKLGNDGGGQAYIFGPNRSFEYTFNAELKVRAWAEIEGRTWVDTAFSSGKERLFLADGTQVFQQGNSIFSGETYATEKFGDFDSEWAVSTAYVIGDKIKDPVSGDVYECQVNHTSSAAGTMELDRIGYPTYWDDYVGEPIDFEWELPWIDGGSPDRIKKVKYGRIGTSGSATFTMDVYVDGLYKDEDGNVIFDPAVSVDFVANQFGQFGQEGEDEAFGGGRRSNDPRLFTIPFKFKRMKVIIHGSALAPVRFHWISFSHSRGGLKFR